MALCKSSVSVTKLVDEGDGIFRPDPDWEITATVTPSSRVATHGCSRPPPPSRAAVTVVTDNDGVAAFQWKPNNPTATSQVSIEEESRPGYEPVGWDVHEERPRADEKVTTSGTGRTLP